MLPSPEEQNHIRTFCSTIAAAGLPIPPDGITPDGEIHRFPTKDRGHDDAGWYVLHLEPIVAGAFGCWRSGIQGTWSAKERASMSHGERIDYDALVKAAREKSEREKIRRAAEAALEAQKLWASCHPATEDHLYLRRKGVQPHGTRIYRGPMVVAGLRCDGALVVPVMSLQGEIRSLEFIADDGQKRFLAGGEKGGNLYQIGTIGPDKRVLLAEGFATGATLHEATGIATIVAFDAGNLKRVAPLLRGKFTVTVCADNDSQTEGNPGLTAGHEAAILAGGNVIHPCFGQGEPGSDFNDLARLHGNKAVLDTLSQHAAIGVVNPIIPALVGLAGLLQDEIPTRKWIVQDWLPIGATTVLHSDGGVGKTLWAFQLGIGIILGRNTAGLDIVQSGPVVFVSAEEDAESCNIILHRICRGLGLGYPEIRKVIEQFKIIDLVQFGGTALYGNVGNGLFGITQLGQHVINYANEIKPALLAIDNASFTYAGPQTEAVHIAAYLNAWRNVSRFSNGAALCLMHEAKQSLRSGERTHAYGGHTSWNNSARQRLEMIRPDDDPNARLISRAKSNYGPKDARGEGIKLIWQSGVFVPEVTGGLVQSIRVDSDSKVVAGVIDQLIRDGAIVSPNPQARNNAQALAKKQGIKHGLSPDRFCSGLRRAVEDGLLAVDKYMASNRTTREKYIMGANFART